MNKKTILFIASLFILICCSSNQDKRLAAMEEDFSIFLPEKYQIIEDSDRSFNGFESDYTQKIKLKFDKKELDTIKLQVEKTYYFDELDRFEGYSMTYSNEKPDALMQTIIDSLKKGNQSGAWIIKENEYKFLFFGDAMDYNTGSLNLLERTLTWTHIHL